MSTIVRTLRDTYIIPGRTPAEVFNQISMHGGSFVRLHTHNGDAFLRVEHITSIADSPTINVEHQR